MAREHWFDAEAHKAGGEENTLIGQLARAVDVLFDHAPKAKAAVVAEATEAPVADPAKP